MDKKAGFLRIKIGEKRSHYLWWLCIYNNCESKKSSDKVVFTKESFVEFPDYYVSNNSHLKKTPQKLNAMLILSKKSMKWGSKVLIDLYQQ